MPRTADMIELHSSDQFLTPGQSNFLCETRNQHLPIANLIYQRYCCHITYQSHHLATSLKYKITINWYGILSEGLGSMQTFHSVKCCWNSIVHRLIKTKDKSQGVPGIPLFCFKNFTINSRIVLYSLGYKPQSWPWC